MCSEVSVVVCDDMSLLTSCFSMFLLCCGVLRCYFVVTWCVVMLAVCCDVSGVL